MNDEELVNHIMLKLGINEKTLAGLLCCTQVSIYGWKNGVSMTSYTKALMVFVANMIDVHGKEFVLEYMQMNKLGYEEL